MGSETRARKFWEYREYDGTVTNLRVRWFTGAVVVSALVGLLAALLGAVDPLWLGPLGGAVIGAFGTLIAFTMDYVHDRKEVG